MRTVILVLFLAALVGAGLGVWYRLRTDPPLIPHVQNPVVRSLLTDMPAKTLAAILSHTSPNVAASLLLELSHRQAEQVLASMSPQEAAQLLTLMNQEGR